MHIWQKLVRNKVFVGIVTFVVVVMCLLLVIDNTFIQQKKEDEKNITSFENTVVTMSSVVENFFASEQDSCDTWAKYINSNKMTLEEALSLVEKSSTNGSISAQIINLDDFTGKATNITVDNAAFDVSSSDKYIFTSVTYSSQYMFVNVSYADQYGAYAELRDTISEMALNDNDINVTVSYNNPLNSNKVFAFVRGVEIYDEEGNSSTMALLRILPASVFGYIWTMPSVYADADVIVIDDEGKYISNTELSGYTNFYDYIKSCNNMNRDDLEKYKADVTGSDFGFATYDFENDEHMLVVHSRLESGGNNWQLVSYIPVESMDKAKFNSRIVGYVLNAVLILFFIDVWHLVEINRQLKKNIKETKEANEAKTRFLSTMSHDIRTPMNAIIGMTAIAGKDAGNKEHVEKCLEKISMSSKHLLTLVNDILDISKIESGKYAVNPIEFSLDDLFENIFNVVKQDIKAKGLELKVNTQGIVHKRLFADQLRLNQIYINILSNAVKYTNEGGKITVDIIQSPSEVIPDGVRMVYRVKDTGIGMSSEFMERMYDSFSRECDGRINTVQGTGLGLAITKQLVDLLGGTIEVESKLGKGSTFTVTLDMETAAIEEAADTEDNGGTGYDLTDFNILIAEDNDLNYEIAESMLEDEGAACTRAENGKVCVDILEKNDSQKFDLVLMDIQMPVMKGIDAAKRIRSSENEEVRNIPIIAMTADAFAENIAECRDAGMDGHIAKPIDMALVLSEIQKVMKKHAHN